MKQTVEESVKEAIHKHYNCNGTYPCSEREYCEHCNGHNTAFDCCECGADEFKEGFIAGANWQAKQSPWISVKERLPEYNNEVIIYHEYRFHVGFMYYSMKSNWWRVSDDERTDMIVNEDDFWMPIPSFDEILEANKDVLERIKEKGD